MIKFTLGYVSVVNQILTLNTEACRAHIKFKAQRCKISSPLGYAA